MSIKIKNTHIEVSPYKRGDIPSIEYDLQVYDRIIHKVTLEAFIIDEETQTLYLPRSFNVAKLKLLLNEYPYVDTSDNYEEGKINFKLLYEPRDKYQFQGIKFLACKDEYEKYSKLSRFNLELGTGIGKTYCAIAASWYYQVITCVIIHNENLLSQWKDRIKSYTNMVDREIYIISGRDSINKLFKKGTVGYKFYLISHRTLSTYMKAEGYKAIDKLFRYLKIGIKIYDEAHLEFANIIKIDLSSNVRKNFYLTASAGRSNKIENKLYGKVLGQAPTLALSLPKKDMNVLAYVLKFNSEISSLKEALMKTIRGLNGYKYLDYIFFDKKAKEITYRAIKISINTLKNIDGQIAILVGMKKVVPEVRKFIEENFEELSNDIGELHSDISKDLRDIQKDKKIIITTYKMFGTGTDIESLKGIINLEPYSSDIIAHQLIGRLRNKGYYIEIYDSSVKKRNEQFDKVKEEIDKIVKKVTINEM